MTKLDKDYMPLADATEEIIAFLTQNISSVQAWSYTQDKGNTLAHVLQKGIKDYDSKVTALTEENARLKEALERIVRDGDLTSPELMKRWAKEALSAHK